MGRSARLIRSAGLISGYKMGKMMKKRAMTFLMGCVLCVFTGFCPSDEENFFEENFEEAWGNVVAAAKSKFQPNVLSQSMPEDASGDIVRKKKFLQKAAVKMAQQSRVVLTNEELKEKTFEYSTKFRGIRFKEASLESNLENLILKEAGE